MILTLLLLAQSSTVSRNELVLQFITTPDAEIARSICPKLEVRDPKNSVKCKIGKHGLRDFFDTLYWSVNRPTGDKWVYATPDEQAVARTKLTEVVRLCYPDCRVWYVKRSGPRKPLWRESIFSEEVIDGAGVMGNTCEVCIDYQTGQILGANRGNYYVPYREPRTSTEAEVDQQIIKREGPFDSKSKCQRWWPLKEVNPKLAKDGRENQVVLLDVITVKRGDEQLIYFFNQAGKPELYPERFAPHPQKEPPPTVFK